ncbi:MAG: flagellar assembly protein FliH [Paraglaciecola sp.]
MSKAPISAENTDQVTTWDLPYVEDTNQALDLKTSNALNHRSDWKYEPPEEEVDILPPTAQEIEEIRAAAQADGFAQGEQEGLAQGLAEGRKQGQEEGHIIGLEEGAEQGMASGELLAREQMTIWSELAQRLHKPVAKVELALEQELVLLAVSLAKAVIRSEVKNNRDIIFQALSEGLKALPIHEKQYEIHLHPEDIVLINEHFSPQDIEKHNWVFVESLSLSRGGCDIVTQTNAVDVTVDRRVRDILDKFLLEQGLGHISQDSDEQG